MDSINTDERVETFLSLMLEGYETNLKNVDQFIEQNELQVNGAKTQRDEIVQNISELKDMLGLSEEIETPSLEIVKDEE